MPQLLNHKGRSDRWGSRSERIQPRNGSKGQEAVRHAHAPPNLSSASRSAAHELLLLNSRMTEEA